MESGIGATLREARSRRKLDLGEVEAAIKIRVRYLQAIENEEWDVLPGVAYTRGFIRTYAIYLGLDGERLADEYKRAATAATGERPPRRVEPVPASARSERRRPSGTLLATAVVLVLVALAVAIGLSGDDDGASAPESAGRADGESRTASQTAAPAPEPGVELSLAATAEVWVCLLDADEAAILDGEILAERDEAGPFRSKRFEIALGNGSVEMTVDGQRADLPPSSSPVGYEIGTGGDLRPLEEGERPDCE